MILGHPISTGFRRLMGCQRNPQDKGVTLPDSLNTLVVSLGNSAPEGTITLVMVRNSIFNEEIRRKDFVSNDTHALIMENKSQSKSRGPSGHNKSRGISKSRGKIKCYHCGKTGHMKRNCKCKT